MNAFNFILAALVGATTIYATRESYKPDPIILCSTNHHCPDNWPCCSQYGQCGRGPLCMGGCDPRSSYSFNSCAVIPAMFPIMGFQYNTNEVQAAHLRMGDMTPALALSFAKLSGKVALQDHSVVENMALSGHGLLHYSEASDNTINIDDYDFTYSGHLEIKEIESDPALVLAMPPGTTGSLLSSTKSFLYGRVAVEMKTAPGVGVITAFVLMSAVKDEIDYEFLGGEVNNAQSNYYYRGELIHTRMLKTPINPDSDRKYHVYELDWDEDRIQWWIDGSIVRTLYRGETFDPVNRVYKYPSTPMRLELAIWPGGLEGNDLGTVMWAGGLIDWKNSADIVEKGRFEMIVKSVKITPYVNAYVQHLEPAESRFPSEDVFYYFYDPECDGCVRITSLMTFAQQELHTNSASVPSVSLLSTLYSTRPSSYTTVSSVTQIVTSAYTSKLSATRQENSAIVLRKQSLIFKLLSWVL
ncbi:LADA_0F13894g1_1 [Lachancea dasiensis]|uniref:LADA_0F13894g1_1 n=1 Tax=Lachancea dasiensis TaxID=1072105 RepID=A0A1G4JMZ8_9SACH|nr:LADA_0F13894g1_1 [Lachancea dasiensis]